MNGESIHRVMTVHLIESNHCEGSCMFYFKYYDMVSHKLRDSALYTGDFRVSVEETRKIKDLVQEPLGTLMFHDEYLGHEKYKTCTLDEVVEYMLSNITRMKKKYANLRVYFAFFTMKKEDS